MFNSLTLFLLQKPFGTPNPDENGIDFSSPFDVVLFIVLPILMVVFYIYWRRQQKKDRE